MFVDHLTCFACGAALPADQPQTLCPCGKPLRVDIDLDRAKEVLGGRRGVPGEGIWRWAPVLPAPLEARSLGEGNTPLIPADSLGKELGLKRGSLFVKDEAINPTGAFKARGMAVAVAMAHRFGYRKLAVPSAGNAGGALAAYAARYAIGAHVFMPRDVPAANRLECELYGAKVTLVDGLIHDCARILAERTATEGWFDVSTLKEPYRVEGKKTMGYEIAEQFGWALPDVIVYPTGGGTGLIGMAKAFDEMERMGWIGAKRPRMISVQAEGCAPIVRAYEAGVSSAPMIQDASTIASGLRVAKAIGDFEMLRIIRETGGCAIAVTDSELIADAKALSASTGVCAAPEGGACLSALRRLVALGQVQPEDQVVLFNTGSGTKYAEAFAA